MRLSVQQRRLLSSLIQRLSLCIESSRISMVDIPILVACETIRAWESACLTPFLASAIKAGSQDEQELRKLRQELLQIYAGGNDPYPSDKPEGPGPGPENPEPLVA
jgi:hypothetical protein